MTKVLENGQLEWIFEELDIEGAITIVTNEYNFHRETLKLLDAELYPLFRKELIKRCDMLLDVRYNLFKIQEWEK